jgi:hypothetical protein
MKMSADFTAEAKAGVRISESANTFGIKEIVSINKFRE